MDVRRIPEVLSLNPPATDAQLRSAAEALGAALPDEVVEMLRQSNGVLANRIILFGTNVLPERNRTYEVADYAPSYVLIGEVNGFPLLTRLRNGGGLFRNDWGAMTEDVMEFLAPGLSRWIDAGCQPTSVKSE